MSTGSSQEKCAFEFSEFKATNPSYAFPIIATRPDAAEGGSDYPEFYQSLPIIDQLQNLHHQKTRNDLPKFHQLNHHANKNGMIGRCCHSITRHEQ
jgi:hypothetical protein